MSRYQEKLAEKNKLDYIKVRRIYLDDFGTYVTSTGEGTFALVGSGSRIDIDRFGNVNISGTSVKINSMNFDFSELPDRNIRPSGVAWTWIANHSKVVGALPIRIKGHKVYIPFMDIKP